MNVHEDLMIIKWCNPIITLYSTFFQHQHACTYVKMHKHTYTHNLKSCVQWYLQYNFLFTSYLPLLLLCSNHLNVGYSITMEFNTYFEILCKVIFCNPTSFYTSYAQIFKILINHLISISQNSQSWSWNLKNFPKNVKWEIMLLKI